MASVALFHVVVLGLSATVTGAVGLVAFRSRDVPGRTPFSLLTLSIAVWTGAYALGLLTPGRTLRVALESVTWFGRATVPVWFLLFVLAYTGTDRFVTRRTVAALLAWPACTIVLVWTNRYHGLVWATDPRVVSFEGLALVVSAVGPAFWLTVVYAYLLIVVGAVLLARLLLTSDHLYADQSALLVVGIVAPFLANAVTVFPPHPVPGMDYTPYGFILTGLAFAYALFRGHLFDLVPATRALGRNAAIAQLAAGVLVVGTDRRVVYCNEAAGDALDSTPEEVLGMRIRTLLENVRLDFWAEDVVEFEQDGRVYEIRTSPVEDRRDRLLGHTLVVHDVTRRTSRERRLAHLDDMNRVIRAVNQSLLSATSRTEIEQTLCERLVETDCYRRACVGDVSSWTGAAERWVDTGDADDPEPPVIDEETFDPAALTAGSVDVLLTAGSGGGTWAAVPLVYGRTVYGVLGLHTDRTTIDELERAVLEELGETVGYAIDASETRQLLAADEVVELEFESRDPDAPLVEATAATSGRLEVTALSPRGDGSHVAYLQVEGGDPSAVDDHLGNGSSAAVREIRERDETTLLEWQLSGESLLGTLANEGARVRRAEDVDDAVRYEVELPTSDAVRSLVDRVHERFPETKVAAKRKRTRPVEDGALPGGVDLDRLTDRQQEVVEVAYRAGYFNWPRDSSAEEVAETLDISSPTLLHHLRTAQKTIVDDIFESDRED